MADVREGVYPDATTWFAYGLDSRGRTRFGALRTSPWFMLATEIDPGDAVPEGVAVQEPAPLDEEAETALENLTEHLKADQPE